MWRHGRGLAGPREASRRNRQSIGDWAWVGSTPSCCLKCPLTPPLVGELACVLRSRRPVGFRADGASVK